jgi:hypothetical protein
MSPKQKKALLGVALALCLLIAGDRIYRFWESHRPLAEVGECLEIVDPQAGVLKFHVMANDNTNSLTEGVIDIEILPGLKVQVPVRVSYEELRGISAKKVSCE